MAGQQKQHPQFWEHKGRDGEEWDLVEKHPERGETLGPQRFKRPERGAPEPEESRMPPSRRP